MVIQQIKPLLWDNNSSSKMKSNIRKGKHGYKRTHNSRIVFESITLS